MDFTEAYTHTCSTVGMAARTGNVDCMQQLITKGRPVDVKDNRGWQPLHEAAYNGHVRCVEILLAIEEVDREWRTYEMETPLMLAARGGHVACVRALLDAGCDLHARTLEDYSPLSEAVLAHSLPCVQELVAAGAEINRPVYTGYTSLHLATEQSDTDIVTYLLSLQHSQRTELDICADSGLTAIFLAAHKGHTDCLKKLLESAKERGQLHLVNKTADDNASPLLLAAQEGHAECVRLLLEYGADPHIGVDTDIDKRVLALQFAAFNNRPKCLELLLPVTSPDKISKMDAQSHPLVIALEQPDTACLEVLIKGGINIHQRMSIEFDQRPEMCGIFDGVIQGFEHKASVLCHITEPDASLRGVEMLIQSGLSPGLISDNELPPLLPALSLGSYELCGLLIQHGASVDIYHKGGLGNMAVVMAVHADMMRSKTTIATFLPLLLLSGAETSSCFLAGSVIEFNSRGLHSVVHYNVLHRLSLVKTFKLLAFLACFCHNIREQHLLILFRLLVCAIENERHDEVCEMFGMADTAGVRRVGIEIVDKIEVSSRCLSHACRRSIVLQMAKCGQYNTTAVHSLPIPQTLLDYLLFTGYGPVGQFILDSFAISGSMSR